MQLTILAAPDLSNFAIQDQRIRNLAESVVAGSVFNTYVDAGGNFIDTANVYTEGRSEELVGKFIAERGLREQLVLATKFTFNLSTHNPAIPTRVATSRKNDSMGALMTDQPFKRSIAILGHRPTCCDLSLNVRHPLRKQ